MLKVPLEMPVPAAVPSVQIIRAVLREYHAAAHTAQVEPILGPASLVGEIPVLMSCRPDLLTPGQEVAVLTWSDVGGVVLGPYGAVPDDPPNAGDADTVDGIHAATTPTASKLLAMNANAKFPTHTIEGSLTVETALTVGPIGTSINEFSIDGSLGGASDDAVPTEKAVKSYVDGQLHLYETTINIGRATWVTLPALLGTFTVLGYYETNPGDQQGSFTYTRYRQRFCCWFFTYYVEIVGGDKVGANAAFKWRVNGTNVEVWGWNWGAPHYTSVRIRGTRVYP